MKKILLVLIVLITATLFLTGCNICCPTCPSQQEEIHPEITGGIEFCDLLEKARKWAPLADYRWMKSEWYDLTSRDDIEWALDKIGPWGCCINSFELIDLFHQLEGYENVPFGYVKYSDGTIRNVAVYKSGEIKAVLLIDGKLEDLISDPLIVEIVI